MTKTNVSNVALLFIMIISAQKIVHKTIAIIFCFLKKNKTNSIIAVKKICPAEFLAPYRYPPVLAQSTPLKISKYKYNATIKALNINAPDILFKSDSSKYFPAKIPINKINVHKFTGLNKSEEVYPPLLNDRLYNKYQKWLAK